MAYAELVEEAKGLSESATAKIIDIVKAFKALEKNEGSHIVFDECKDKLKYMAEDFDETPDCFKEYM